ncbi:MAG: hypothetical protein Q7S58_05875 [Candidatus Binatus sp.]|nr:hypothetical protein [Candidatus Binatus sp.]MDO8431924.1 hypothetical protein [Candidatus Binatus sp.]
MKHPLYYEDANKENRMMRYGIAWLLGVPVSVLVLWYVVSHVL